ncbi:pyrroline-5-carboxylate reductase [Ammoniphilus sp. 3BR4]|uniref:pyrroline-5-carboxylate reductase n=1 Tax=Ammoniphilus sp. 3BR4 TaxID=3158265 RepID=UPI0034652970
MLSDKKVCFIGAGAMAEAVLAGMLNKRIIKPGAVSITNRSDRFRLDELVYNFGVVADANQKESSIQEADILILAMKPKDVESAVKEIKHLTNPNQLIISVVAGITTAFITSLLGHNAPVIRTMPNTSATIGLSSTGMCQGKTATEVHLELARHIFESIGMVAVVEEEQLDAVTGLSGSGPAYVYYLVEAMLAGGVKAGLDEQVARELILQTLIGAAHMLKETGEDPAVLREKVTSPNGTTQAGLDKLRSYRFEEALVACVLRATERSKELGAILSETKS